MDGSTIVTLLLTALLSIIGAVQLAGPRFVREAYETWDYAQGLRLIMGILDLAAAVMLATPSHRGWGITLAAVLIFGSVVTMLNHRQYASAAAAALMMAALVPASVAIPRADRVQFIAAAPQLVASNEGLAAVAH